MNKPGALPKHHQPSDKIPNRHCKEDIACQHCCACWIKFKKSYEQRNHNLQKENQKIKQENKFLHGVNLELTRKMDKVDGIQKQMNDLEGVQRAVRDELWEKLLEEKQVEDTLRNEKIAYLKTDLQEKMQEI